MRAEQEQDRESGDSSWLDEENIPEQIQCIRPRSEYDCRWGHRNAERNQKVNAGRLQRDGSARAPPRLPPCPIKAARLSGPAEVAISIICTAHLATNCNLFLPAQEPARGVPAHRDVGNVRARAPTREIRNDF